MNINRLKDGISKLDSTEFLDIVQTECKKRRVDRDNIKGGNDIEINKIYLLLTDNFWMRKIYVVLYNGEYRGFKYTREEAEQEVNNYNYEHKGFTHYGGADRADYKEEIIDLRDVY